MALMTLILLGTGAEAASEKARFDVYLQGQKQGDLRVQGREKGAKYSAELRLKIKGDMPFTVEAKVQGQLVDAAYVPVKYTEKRTDADGKTGVTITYPEADGPPSVARRGEAAPHWLMPEAGTGLADPATVLWQLMQSRLPEAACNLDLRMFDGARILRLRTLEPAPRGPSITCNGNLFREKGFSDEELEVFDIVNFVIEYAPVRGGLMQTSRINLDLPQGRVILVRR
ncbi:hypothetical protein ATO11_00530 [Pseudaestuariivita atlantica]|uniref:DUF3108 domain-containing protein n=1 Tax=Pseudaestuariivita atlantica TaxID=1317121 RepID=A0A0L1JU06_9RHOB|nr:hypothetical protein ATO11_00530 [Pseudaestuariivita atlantica]